MLVYLGPGLGIGTIIMVLVIVLIVVFSVFVLLLQPIRRFWAKIKKGSKR